MVIVMEKHIEEAKIETVVAELIRRGFDVHRSTGADQTVLGVVGDVASVDPREFELFDGVQEVVRVSEPYKLSSRTFKKDKTIIELNGCRIGGKDVIVMVLVVGAHLVHRALRLGIERPLLAGRFRDGGSVHD